MSNAFGLSCPSGGKFYICQGNATEFIGCCSSNPCADGKGTCPQKDIKPATFSADSFKEIPAQQCAGSNSAALWYTCQKTSPPFLGCCTSNPCSSGSCPASRLAPARLSSNSASRAAFISMGAQPTKSATKSTTSTRPTSTATTSTSTTTPSASSSSVPSTQPPSSSSGLSTGAVAGIAVGIAGIVFAGMIFAFVAYKRGWFRRKERDSDTVPFITGSVSPYEPHASLALAPQRSSHPPSFGLLTHAAPPASPPSRQQLYPGYAPQSPPLSSNPGSAHSSPRIHSYHSSTPSQPLSELETPLMLSELPNNEPAESNAGAPQMLRPAGGTPQRWNTNSTSNELHLWDGNRNQRGYGRY